MNIPTIEQWKAAAETLIIWGGWVVVYGLATMVIGAIVLIAIAALSNPVKKSLK